MRFVRHACDMPDSSLPLPAPLLCSLLNFPARIILLDVLDHSRYWVLCTFHSDGFRQKKTENENESHIRKVSFYKCTGGKPQPSTSMANHLIGRMFPPQPFSSNYSTTYRRYLRYGTGTECTWCIQNQIEKSK